MGLQPVQGVPSGCSENRCMHWCWHKHLCIWYKMSIHLVLCSFTCEECSCTNTQYQITLCDINLAHRVVLINRLHKLTEIWKHLTINDGNQSKELANCALWKYQEEENYGTWLNILNIKLSTRSSMLAVHSRNQHPKQTRENMPTDNVGEWKEHLLFSILYLTHQPLSVMDKERFCYNKI